MYVKNSSVYNFLICDRLSTFASYLIHNLTLRYLGYFFLPSFMFIDLMHVVYVSHSDFYCTYVRVMF